MKKLRLRWRAFVLDKLIRSELKKGDSVEAAIARAVERVPRSWVAKIDAEGNLWLR